MKVKNWFNAVPVVGEINSSPSETIPDQSMTISEIMYRFSRGLPLAGQRHALYDQEDDLPDPRTLDMVDIQDLRRELNEIRSNEAKRKSRIETEKRSKDQKAAFEAAVKKALENHNAGKSTNPS